MDKAEAIAELESKGFQSTKPSGETFGWDFYEYTPPGFDKNLVCYTNGQNLIVQESGGTHSVCFDITGLTKDELAAKIVEQAKQVLSFKGALDSLTVAAEPVEEVIG